MQVRIYNRDRDRTMLLYYVCQTIYGMKEGKFNNGTGKRLSNLPLHLPLPNIASRQHQSRKEIQFWFSAFLRVNFGMKMGSIVEKKRQHGWTRLDSKSIVETNTNPNSGMGHYCHFHQEALRSTCHHCRHFLIATNPSVPHSKAIIE